MTVITKMPKLELQLYQLYNDDIKDLLSSKKFVPKNGQKKDMQSFDKGNSKNKKEYQQCKTKVDKQGNYIIDGVTSVMVDNLEDCLWFID